MSRPMKNSGVEWLGEVPEQWEINPLKISVLQLNGGIWGDEANGDENDVDCVRIADFDRARSRVKGDRFTVRNIPLEKQGNFILKKGDLLIEKSGGGEKTPVGSVILYDKDERAVFTNFIARISVNKHIADSSFFTYVHSALFSNRITVRSIKQTTGIQNLDINNYLKEAVPYPSLTEQRNIVSFLDQKTAQIDSIIGDTKQSIVEFKKYKQALITEAVTKGLNLNVKMKDSRIEWIGEIPEHWGITKLGQIYDVILGKMLSSEQKSVDWTLEQYICAANVHFEGVDTSSLKSMWFSPNEKMNLEVKNGDLLIVEGGAGAGGSAIYSSNEENLYIQNSINIVRSRDEKGNTRYAYYLMYSLVKNGYVDFISSKATFAHFTKEKVKAVPYPVIPQEEQQQIVDYLDEKCTHIDSLIADKETLIHEFEDYKKALIFEYVTGKKEVE